MANSCEFKTAEASTKSQMRTQGLIDDKLIIKKLNDFRIYVTKWSKYATNIWGIQGRLFSEEPFNNKLRAVPNKEMFKKIDNAKGIYYQKVSVEGKIASEKTIRDLSAKMSDRIGMSVRFESDRSKQYKGKIENNTAYVNLAYATLDTPVHEILGHPIIRAIKKNSINLEEYIKFENDIYVTYYKNSKGELIQDNLFNTKNEALKYIQKSFDEDFNINNLYNNLLKELEYGRGKEILDRIKRDYVNKEFNKEEVDELKKELLEFENDLLGFADNSTYLQRTKEKIKENLELINSLTKDNGKYTLEEQQEEAIVELLGLMTANKLDNVKDGKLISLLKRLLKEMKQFIRSLLNQKEVEIDKLPDNMTLGDLSDLLAYSNSKLILPGYEVEYTTPDNVKFKTYQEANNHISNLIKNIKDIDLSKISLVKELSAEEKAVIHEKELKYSELQNYYNSEAYQLDKAKNLKEQEDKLYDLENKEVKFYSQEIHLKLQDKLKFGFEDYDYVRTESTYSRPMIYDKELYGYGAYSEHREILGENYKGYYIHGYNNKKGSDKKILPITKEQAEEIWNTDPYNKLEIMDQQNLYNLKGKISNIKDDAEIKHELHFIQSDIDQIKSGNNSILGFITKNKEYEQSKEIIDEWKKVNNIQYNPEEVYSRGQGFYSVVGAYSNFDINLMFQNLLQHIEDNEKSGGEFTISAFTKSINSTIYNLDEGGGKIRFEIYPQSKDIKWASNTDVYSGSVWDASIKVSKNKKSELLGVSYTKSPALRSVNTVQPNLSYIIDNLNHYHNELGISITGNNFRLIYDDDIPYETKKIINSINSILDQKYGKLSKPEIKTFNREDFYSVVPGFEDTSFKEKYKDVVQPTQTNETLKESIDGIKSKLDIHTQGEYPSNASDVIYAESSEEENDLVNKGYSRTGRLSDEGFREYALFKNKPKEYTSQALINTKIAVLKSITKKYPRSLIRSEVKSAHETNIKYLKDDTFAFQKIDKRQEILTSVSSFETLSKVKEGVDFVFEQNPELANKVYEVLGFNNVISYKDKIIWGHPAIGKTTMLESNPNAFIDWDNEFNRKRDNWIASKSNNVIGSTEFKKARNEYMINYNNHKDYTAFVTEEWSKIKEKANKENKTLIASPHMLLNLFPNDFNKVITMSDKTFIDRAIKRSGGDEVNSKLWKEGINKTLMSVDKSKIIETDKYINDLFITPQQKQQALQLYSQYLNTIFPDSKVKDIVYHGSSTEFKGFNKNRVAYLTDNKFYAENFLDLETPNAIGYPLIVNIKNPIEITDKKLLRQTYGNFINPEELLNNNIDGVIGTDAGQKEGKTFVVKNPEQIHLLGSKEDIEGFKRFKTKKQELFYSIKKEQKVLQGNIDFVSDISSMLSDPVFIKKYVGFRRYFDITTDIETMVGTYGHYKNGLTQPEPVLQELQKLIYSHIEGSNYQLNELPSSEASKETLNKVKEAAQKMGISIQSLTDYMKANPDVDTKSINGVADLLKGVIAVAYGMESVALTEEMVHLATAILEQTNPKLITQLISKIDRFKIYNLTLAAYKNNKNYQLSDGKPDIRKIKKEAVDKLLAEVIINQSEGSTEFPELMKEEERSIIKQWWDTILDYLRSVYKKSNIDIFEEVAAKVISGDVGGTVKDITGKEIYLQQKNNLVDNFYDIVKSYSSRIDYNPESPTDTRHYMFDKTIRVLQSVTEKVKKESGKKFSRGRTPAQKISDDQKKTWGTIGHDFMEKYITKCLIDKDGYKLAIPLDEEIESKLNTAIEKKLKAFAVELINSYKEGTRFLIEEKVINTEVKGKIASKIDFMAIEPIIKKDGTPDIRVDILDWKFTSIDKTKDEDIPYFKQKEWIPQMGEYTRMFYNYGLKQEQLRKARMIPFISNYEYILPGDSKSGLALKSLEIGKVDSLTETNLYLLPVPIPSESTGNARIDDLLKALREQYDKLYILSVSPEEFHLKKIQLNQLSAAIRNLHLRLDFHPLYNVGVTFLDNAAKAFKEFEKTDYSTLTQEELEKRLADILEYQESAKKFTDLDAVFLSHFPKKGLSKEDKDLLNSLETLAIRAGRMLDTIETVQTQAAFQVGISNGFNLNIIENEKGDVRLQAETAINGGAKTFLEGSKLASKIINLVSNIIMNTKSLVERRIANEIDRFEKVLIPLEEEARASNKSAFDLIGRVTGDTLKLIRRVDKKFMDDIKEAQSLKNKKFLLDNIDKEAYTKLADAAILKGEERINTTQFSSESKNNENTQKFQRERLRQLLDITRSDFDGYEDPHFLYLFNQTVKIENHYSEDYKQMAKSEAALNAWKFFTELNDRGKKMGYLTKQGISFFPLVEATVLQKFYQNKDVGAQLKDSFTDLYTVRTDEGQTYSKKDEKTGKEKKEIHKRFLRTDKEVSALSRDLNKVGTVWIKSLIEFEQANKLKSTLFTLHTVHKASGSLALTSDGTVIREGGRLKVEDKINKNATILLTIIEDYLFNLNEDASSMGSSLVSGVAGKLSKTEEEKEEKTVSFKKGLKSLDTHVRALAVGLNPLIGIANWAGGQFQAFINAGNMYQFWEFTKNNFKITTGIGLSTVEKGLLNYIHPLNEDITVEKSRMLAKKQSFIAYLGTWSYTDVMMVTNSAPERKLQFANAMSFNANSMVVDGKIVNIRQYLKKEDRLNRNTLSYEERRQLEKTFESRVLELKETSSLLKIAEIKDDKVIIPGVSDIEIAKYRTKVIEYGRELNGQMNSANKAGFRRDSILNSFMMFKTWIPKLISVRALDLKKNVELDEWQYGRARAFIKTWVSLCNWNVSKLREIYLGTDEGLRLIDEMLQAKKDEHFRKTGEILEITNEEFQDLIRKQITDQFKELGLLFGLLTVVLVAKIAAPPDDEDDLTKNRYKQLAKMINKITDEISFYYDPRSADSITKGSIIPALGLLVKIEKMGQSLMKESAGYLLDDEEMIGKAYPIKYILDIFPVISHFDKHVLPYVNPELAKEMGIRVSPQSRMQ
jgi:hypothetical protein